MSGAALMAKHSGGTSDLYCKVELAGVKHKTKAIQKSLEPVWDERFDFKGVLGDLIQKPLLLNCYDNDASTVNDSLGEVKLALESFTLNSAVTYNDFPLSKAKSGALSFTVSWKPDDKQQDDGSLVQGPCDDLSSMPVGWSTHTEHGKDFYCGPNGEVQWEQPIIRYRGVDGSPPFYFDQSTEEKSWDLPEKWRLVGATWDERLNMLEAASGVDLDGDDNVGVAGRLDAPGSSLQHASTVLGKAHAPPAPAPPPPSSASLAALLPSSVPLAAPPPSSSAPRNELPPAPHCIVDIDM